MANNETELTTTTKKKGWIYRTISAKISRRVVAHPSKNIKKYLKMRILQKIYLWDHHYQHQKDIAKNVVPRSSDDYRCKKIEQNVNELIFCQRYEKGSHILTGGIYCQECNNFPTYAKSISDTPHNKKK